MARIDLLAADVQSIYFISSRATAHRGRFVFIGKKATPGIDGLLNSSYPVDAARKGKSRKEGLPWTSEAFPDRFVLNSVGSTLSLS
jgi:hypothetical protein